MADQAAILTARPPVPATPAPPASRIWAVAVAFDRDAELERLLHRLAAQTLKLAGVVVVDSANLASTAALAARHGAAYIGSATNLGGAGGFALGMLTALARGAEAIWLWDDDGYPEADTCLELLHGCAQARRADVVSPMVVAEHDPTQTAFAFRLDGRRTTARSDVQRHAQIDGFAHLFNGALVQSSSLTRVGLPDYRLFIRGDEVDFGLRVRRSGGLIVTFTAAVARHPSGLPDVGAIAGLPFGVVCPANPARRPIAFRNRAFVFRQHRQWLYLLTDPLRYAAFFLLRRRPDWAGFSDWRAATWQGWRGVFGEPAQPRPAPSPRTH